MNYSTITVADFISQMRAGSIPLCIDVRNEDEFAQRHCRGTRNLPLPVFDERRVRELIDDAGLDEKQTVYLMCAAGKRSQMAAEKLAGKLANPICIVSGGGVGDLSPDLHA